MIKSTIKFSMLAVAALALAALPVSAAEKTADKPDAKAKKDTKEPAKAKADSPKAVPYKGKLTAKTDTSITLGDRVIEINSDTKITKDSKPATLADVAVGEDVTGQYHIADGKQVARSVMVKTVKPKKVGVVEKETAKKPAKTDKAKDAKSSATEAAPATTPAAK